jgi:DNA-binding CsgD family transcriptional regulator
LTAVGDRADLEDALPLCAQALSRARAIGDLGAQADLVFLLEVLAYKAGRLTDARVHLGETAELASHLGSTLRLIDIIDEGGYLCVATGQHAEALTLWAAMTAQNQATGLVDTLEGEHRRAQPQQAARNAMDARQVRAAEERGAAMTLAAAVDFALLVTADNDEPVPADTGTLSARERELVALVAQGRTDAEIAEKLFISVSTVRTHLDRIRDKSGCRRRADLTRLALQEGII